jgi:16S rRNA (guanine966-N2)-methyltransferase
MRVIAGSAGGVRLAVPKRSVRPTMGRVKGAIFSSLGDAIIGARVLDLFAGSGALGIEALSRGAASAVFVEADPQTAAMIDQNLAKTKLKGHVQNQDVFDFLHRTSNAETFQIIFADPPYEKTQHRESHAKKLLKNKMLPQLLETRGIFVLEKQPGEALPEMSFWRVARQKAYGATEVLFLGKSEIGRRGQGSPRQKAKPRRVAASKRGKRVRFNRQSGIV